MSIIELCGAIRERCEKPPPSSYAILPHEARMGEGCEFELELWFDFAPKNCVVIGSVVLRHGCRFWKLSPGFQQMVRLLCILEGPGLLQVPEMEEVPF